MRRERLVEHRALTRGDDFGGATVYTSTGYKPIEFDEVKASELAAFGEVALKDLVAPTGFTTCSCRLRSPQRRLTADPLSARLQRGRRVARRRTQFVSHAPHDSSHSTPRDRSRSHKVEIIDSRQDLGSCL